MAFDRIAGEFTSHMFGLVDRDLEQLTNEEFGALQSDEQRNVVVFFGDLCEYRLTVTARLGAGVTTLWEAFEPKPSGK